MPIKGFNGQAARQWFRENVLSELHIDALTVNNSYNVAEKIIDPKGGVHDVTESGLVDALDEANAAGGGFVQMPGKWQNDITISASLPAYTHVTIGTPVEATSSMTIIRDGDFPVFSEVTSGESWYQGGIIGLQLGTENTVTVSTPLIRYDSGIGDTYQHRLMWCRFDAEGDGTGGAPILNMDGWNNNFVGFNSFARSDGDGIGNLGNAAGEASHFVGNLIGEAISGIGVTTYFGKSNWFYNIVRNTGSHAYQLGRGSDHNVIGGVVLSPTNKGVDIPNVASNTDDNTIYAGGWNSAPVDATSGQRTLTNGWGFNDGDPSAGGDWNGNGREGVNVRDTTNNANYAYLNGAWVSL